MKISEKYSISNIKDIYKNNKFLLLKILKYNKTLFFIRIFFSFIASFSSLATLLLPKYLLQALINNNIKQLILILIIYGIIVSIINLINLAYSNYNRLSSEKTYLKIINDFLKKGISLDMSFYDKSDSYSQYSRAFGNCCNVIDSCSTTILSVISAIINIIMITGVLVWTDFRLFFMIIFFIIVNIAINNHLQKIGYDINVKLSKLNKQVNYLYRLFYTPQFIREIKTNTMEDFVFEKKENINKEILKISKKQIQKNSKYNILLNFLSNIEYISVALYFAFSVFRKLIDVTDYFTSINAYQQIKAAINNLLSSYTSLYSNSLFAKDYIEFIQSQEDTTTNINGLILSPEKINSIRFENISFKYPNSDSFALSDISFEINKTDKVAIVGKNGAGKTTIIKLLLRLYNPQKGNIFINNIDIKEYNTYSLRSSITTLFQDYAIYAFSILDNISLGKNVEIEKIENALKNLDLYDKINSLPKKLSTPITSQLYDDGVELSGGETQKIAISRIFASQKDNGFFILDEPTSSLDPYAEYKLYNSLLEKSNKDNTFIVISHRLTLTHKMSKIIVLDHGKISEIGTHDNLIKSNKIYSEMYNLQVEKYVSK